jgi:hypothetical protein
MPQTKNPEENIPASNPAIITIKKTDNSKRKSHLSKNNQNFTTSHPKAKASPKPNILSNKCSRKAPHHTRLTIF